MRLSIALCTYNGLPYLHEQLASIANQTRPPDEVIVRDDGSTDDTLAVVDEFARSVPFRVDIKQNPVNLGATINFEQAILACSGDVICLCDQDDIWMPNKLAVIEAVFAHQPNVGLVFSDADVIDRDGKSLGFRLWQSVRFGPRQQQQMQVDPLAVLLRHPVVTGAASAFRSQFKAQVTPIDPSWIHDEWIALIIATLAHLLPISQALLQYRQHGRNQVGAESLRPVDRLRVALSTDPRIYLRRADQFRALSEYAQRILPDQARFQQLLSGKREHFTIRGSLPDARLRRIVKIWREFHSGHYQRFSGSRLNAIRDLLLRHPR